MLKYKIKVPTSGVTEIKLNTPIIFENQMVDQTDIINTKFVDVEVKEAINPILDYEKTKFKPFYNFTPCNTLTYNVSLLNGNNYLAAGFNDNEIKNRVNSFKNTFIRLNFYDSDRLTDQRLLFFITLFSNIYEVDIVNSTKPLSFKVTNETLKTVDPSEGFNIFYFKDSTLLNSNTKEIYMRAEFNNAKTGKITNLMAKNTIVSIDQLVKQLHTKYLLKKDSIRGYYYEISNEHGNVNGTSNRVINLFETNSL